MIFQAGKPNAETRRKSKTTREPANRFTRETAIAAFAKARVVWAKSGVPAAHRAPWGYAGPVYGYAHTVGKRRHHPTGIDRTDEQRSEHGGLVIGTDGAGWPGREARA